MKQVFWKCKKSFGENLVPGGSSGGSASALAANLHQLQLELIPVDLLDNQRHSLEQLD